MEFWAEVFNPFKRNRPECPVCHHGGFVRERFGSLMCGSCGIEVRIPDAYARRMWLLVLTALTVLAVPTYNHRHAGTWLLLLILTALPVRVFLGRLIPPWLEVGKPRSRLSFVVWCILMAVGMPLITIVWGWLHVLLGNRRELLDFVVASSFPLAWISRDFLLDSNKSFFDACGVVLGNSFFYALWGFIAYRSMHAVMRRSRPTKINIDGSSVGDDEEE